MKKFVKVLKFLWAILFYGGLTAYIALLGISQYDIYNIVSRVETQQHELYDNQASQYDEIMAYIELNNLILATQDQILSKTVFEIVGTLLENDKQQVKLSKSILGIVEDRTDKVPYDYLTDRTVIIFQEIPNTERGYLGTGVIVKITADFTYILTNKHMVQGCNEYLNCYTLDSEGKRSIEVVKKSSFEYDIALVKVTGKLLGKKAIEKIVSPKIQERVYMVGHNLGRLYIYAEGYIAGYDTELNKSLVVGISSGPGNSGSGIINSKGELVGLLWGGRLVSSFPYRSLDTSSALCVDGKILKLFLKDIL